MALWKEGEQVAQTDGRETLIGKGCELDGNLTVHGNLFIEGKVKGHIQVDGQLVVGPGAQVVADVVADTLRIEGEVTGELKASTLIALQPSAKVKGSLEAPSLGIEKGALFEGTCKMHVDKPNVVALPQPKDGRPQAKTVG